jgi:hypothetical protein
MSTIPRATDRGLDGESSTDPADDTVASPSTPDGPSQQGSNREWLAPLRRWWWLPAVVGVLAGIFVASLAGAPVGHNTSAVVNTRAASSLPNERIDLINDLSVALRVSEVVGPVAKAVDMSPAAVRKAISVSRVQASTLVRITATTQHGDDAVRRRMIEAFLDAAVAYLQPPSPSRALAAAEKAERRAITAYYGAIEANAGVPPTDELTRLQQRIVQAARDGDRARRVALTRQLPPMIDAAARFTELTSRRDRAIANARTTSQSDLIASNGGIAALSPSFLDGASDTDSITSSVALRRGVAGGAAAAVLVAALVLVLGRARRLR